MDTFASFKDAKEYVSGWKNTYLKAALEKISDAEYDLQLWPTRKERILKELTESIEVLHSEMLA